MTAILRRSLSVSDTINVIGLVLNVVIGICTILISWAVWRLTQKSLRGRGMEDPKALKRHFCIKISYAEFINVDLESDNLAVSLVVERRRR